MSLENRQHARYAVDLRAEVTLGFETVGATTENISAGGVGIALDAALTQGTELDVTLILTQDGIEDPFEEPFDIRGVVAWCKPHSGGGYAVGLRFKNPSEEQRTRLAFFIARVSV